MVSIEKLCVVARVGLNKAEGRMGWSRFACRWDKLRCQIYSTLRLILLGLIVFEVYLCAVGHQNMFNPSRQVQKWPALASFESTGTGKKWARNWSKSGLFLLGTSKVSCDLLLKQSQISCRRSSWLLSWEWRSNMLRIYIRLLYIYVFFSYWCRLQYLEWKKPLAICHTTEVEKNHWHIVSP